MDVVKDLLELLVAAADQLRRAHPQQLRARVAEHLAGGRIHLDEAHGGAIHHGDRIGRRVHGRAEALQLGGALLHLLLQEHALVAKQVAERLQAQEVAHAQPQLAAIDRLGEKLLRPGLQARERARCGPRGAVTMITGMLDVWASLFRILATW
jgi:hypothetical protein